MFTVFKALKAPNGRRCRPMCCGRATKRDALPFSCFVFIQVCYHTKPSFNLNFPTKPPKIARLWFRRVFCSTTRSNTAHRAKHGVICANKVNNATMQMTLSVIIFYNAERTHCNVAIFILVSTTPSLCRPFGFGY